MEEIIINIAVVEDEQQQILNYQNYLDRFQKESHSFINLKDV